MTNTIKTLLSVGVDTKTVKGEKFGVMTGILYLAPHNLSGYQVCPKASEGCKAVCLFTAGMGVYMPVQKARIARTKFFFENRQEFMNIIVKDIQRLIKKAAKVNMQVAIRLNGTSDICWEKFKVTVNAKEYRNIMCAFPDINFYDYTKILGRASALNQKNYHLTFSLSENNDSEAKQALDTGYNLAVVMRVGRTFKLPKEWSGYKVIDGDVSDIRFKNKKGSQIIGLRMKGKARKDTLGFVRNVDSSLN